MRARTSLVPASKALGPDQLQALELELAREAVLALARDKVEEARRFAVVARAARARVERLERRGAAPSVNRERIDQARAVASAARQRA